MKSLCIHAVRQISAKSIEEPFAAQACPTLPKTYLNSNIKFLSDLQDNVWFALAPGASFSSKRAPKQFFLAVLTHLEELWNARYPAEKLPGIVFLGGDDDRTIVSDIQSSLTWGGKTKNFAGELSLFQSSMALRHCVFAISNDSSIAHIAEAVQTPALVCFGPTVEGFGFAPHLPLSQSFSSRLGCRPCSKHGNLGCRFNDQRCFSDIPVTKIANKAFLLLVRHREETYS